MTGGQKRAFDYAEVLAGFARQADVDEGIAQKASTLPDAIYPAGVASANCRRVQCGENHYGECHFGR